MVAFHGCLKNTECTVKSPDPLYYFFLVIKGSGTETILGGPPYTRWDHYLVKGLAMQDYNRIIIW